MEDKFIQRVIISVIIILMGIIEMVINSSIEVNFGYLTAIIGGILFILSIASNIKYQVNKEEIDKEFSRKYDERDDLIDGKVAKFTLRVLIAIILLTMFISNWVKIQTDNALLIIIISFMVTEFLARKYYNSRI
ncbi:MULTISPECIES: hypothetical protein [Romboutsia]|uniref:Uncharacterized protein n=1 Tax=Romboutsia hominis TaxID=1507512 RepID=A0A2P2BQ42_9FIRM|nr:MULTISPECIES: hypothetical protein [Romboutsia]MCH1959785.1 hypothetical protein [Romboutsia hominis]MCH1969791.1 hypothetical protein [Romboutsia hominis]MDB8803720.1 hypothetical protein [Romboutsia sp. 1001216sp1]MDB8806930.1 hypothetical protein [Romboutsia sp. 1001216sp1]MDB8809367.1 hypothetical protein [Romboutsia sp. 1001216sp1]